MADKPHPEVDQRWLREYVDYGVTLIIAYLSNYAAFDRWLAEHPPPQEEEPPCSLT